MLLDILYNLFITPIELIIEFVFSIINRFASNPGFAIIGVSLVINFLVLPLYKKSDALQEVERNKQKEMKPWLDHIKKNFKGDERYMMTQTYYRQQGYKPVYALRSSISLLLQIPFFIAAYHYLSNLELLQGASFLCFSNLGEPDQLIPFFGGLHLNLLPILMTAINVISGAIYTRGYPLKEKIQLYAIALIFLVLLYNSPSGLVFYWTLNNLFSLCKNIVMKGIHLPKREKKPDPKLIDKKLFFLGTIFLTLFMGAFIPLSVISSSPTEFIMSDYGPITLLINTLSVYVGFWIVWCSIFYYLASPRGKNIFTYAVWIFSIVSVIDFYFFGTDYGEMNSYLVFDNEILSNLKEILINGVVVLVLCVALFFIIKKLPKLVKAVTTILIIACVGVSAYNVVKVQIEVNSVEEVTYSADGVIKLSENGQNVIVFMVDRAISEYLPQILEENPEIAESLGGFTYYPNTISFGNGTNYSTPSLFGGYEYTPTEINERSEETLSEKQNEAISVLPRIFSEEGYISTACDIPYAGNYKWVPDMSYYEQYGVSGYNTTGAYSNTVVYDDEGYHDSYQKRNFVCYSIFKSIPVAGHGFFYNGGNYLTTLVAKGVDDDFWNAYSTLCNLDRMTDVIDGGNTFLMFQNATTHEPVLLDDEYEPDPEISTLRENKSSEKTYDVNMAVMLRICDWLDYLREQGVYDNTKIIICSDHSFNLDDESTMTFTDIGLDAECYNPLLLVKDFNATEFSISDEFMTLADVATIATDGSIEDPINPFTGNAIDSSAKTSEDLLITTSTNHDTYSNNGNVFDTSDGQWWKVTPGDITDSSNWTKVE